MLAMKFNINLCFLIFIATHIALAKVPEKLSVTLPSTKTPQNPLSNFVQEIPLMKVISEGTLPHSSSIHYLRAQVSKNNFDIPIQFEWESDILISDTVLINPNVKFLRSLILQHFEAKEDKDLDLEWIRAPSYDFHENEFSFIAKIKLSEDSWRFFSKTIYLTQDGYLGFQILTPYHDKLSTYHKIWSEALSIKDTIDYKRSSNPRVRDMRELLKRWSIPFGATLSESDSESSETNLNENTRRTIGITFLIFSILFFIFLNPKAKDQ